MVGAQELVVHPYYCGMTQPQVAGPVPDQAESLNQRTGMILSLSSSQTCGGGCPTCWELLCCALTRSNHRGNW